MSVGQLSFEGREITGVELNIPGVGVRNLGELGFDDVPKEGDRIRFTAELVVGRPAIGAAKYDRDTGLASSEAIRSHPSFIVASTFKVTEYLKREDVETMWKDAHGATGA